MIHLITDPKGHEAKIQKLQTLLYNSLSDTWEIGETNFQGYGLAQKGSNNAGAVPICFNVRTDKDYKEVGWDDKNVAMFFFGTGDTIEYTAAGASVDAYVCFFVNLVNTNKENSQRRATDVRMDVFNILRKGMYGTKVTNELTGIDRVLAEYDGLKNSFDRFDYHPMHCFRYNFTINYKP